MNNIVFDINKVIESSVLKKRKSTTSIKIAIVNECISNKRNDLLGNRNAIFTLSLFETFCKAITVIKNASNMFDEATRNGLLNKVTRIKSMLQIEIALKKCNFE